MTTAKAWRQKGTGRARIGAHSVPHRRGGGVAFGPKPHTHTVKVNRKARRRALRAALSVHAARGSIAVLEAGAFSEPSAKDAAAALGRWDAKAPVLVVLDAEETAPVKSFRNLPDVSVLPVSAVGVVDVIGHASLVVSASALEGLASRAGETERGAQEG
jgi:large subunit ribosomal protein L4